jgi:hypothetical protein
VYSCGSVPRIKRFSAFVCWILICSGPAVCLPGFACIVEESRATQWYVSVCVFEMGLPSLHTYSVCILVSHAKA